MSTPTQVYIVTDGDYSDYRILAVFLDKETADEYAAQQSATVETHEIGKLYMPKGMRWWRVDMDEAGDLRMGYAETVCVPDFPYEDENQTDLDMSGSVDGPRIWRNTGYRVFYVQTKRGEEGAIKVANERRVQLIAANQWPKKGEEAK